MSRTQWTGVAWVAEASEPDRVTPDREVRAGGDALRRFRRSRVLAVGARPDPRVGRVVESWTRRHALTPREVELVLYALRGTSHAVILREKAIARPTLRSQVRGLLRKLGAINLVDVRARLLSDALHDGVAEPAAVEASARTRIEVVSDPRRALEDTAARSQAARDASGTLDATTIGTNRRDDA